MDVRGFPAHGVEQALFVAFLGQGRKLDVAAVRSEPANDPATAEMQMGIGNPYGVVNNLLLQQRSVVLLLRWPKSMRSA